MQSPFLVIESLRKQYGREAVLHGVDVGVAEHETLSVLGPSGCGKTTLLKIIAGLEQPDAGRVLLRGVDVTHQPPQARGIVYLYQEPLLFPHLNVFENVAFGLRLRKTPAAEVRQRVTTLLDELGIASHAEKRPDQLSGGQRQRVAFGRAIIINPVLLLLDEPFAALDTEIRAVMQQLFQRLTRQYQITSLFVTHDLKEALIVGDRFGRMDRGTLHVYADRNAFIKDPDTGVQQEITFWENLNASS